MLRSVDWQKVTELSEEISASFFSAQDLCLSVCLVFESREKYRNALFGQNVDFFF